MSKGKSHQHKAAKTDPSSQLSHPFVVGIGASAGGLQALDELFQTIPLDSVAYMVIQHLAQEPQSLLKDFLTRHTKLKILEAEEGLVLEENCVYYLPAGKQVTLQQNQLHLENRHSDSPLNRTIDTFFKSLAADKGPRAIGIVLSGTGSDGTEGIIEIKKAGGLVIAHDPASAKFDGMPGSAIQTGFVDFILPPALMADEILNYIKVNPFSRQMGEVFNKESEGVFLEIIHLIQTSTGIDFSHYKRPTILRRLARRMAMTNTGKLADYLDYLHQHEEEVTTLAQEFLIGVTKFFRDQEAFEFIRQYVIPSLVEPKSRTDQLRLWVAGCSTGEEAYSLGILIREYLDQIGKEIEVKIFASDIDREALEFASKGLYPASALTEVSPQRLQDFFLQEEGQYKVAQRVRRMVIFSPHNVSNDPPFSRIDLVSCRNMLIYLNPLLQKKVLAKFHYALNLGGYLFLGSSESIGDMKNFAEVNKKWKIFRNTEPAHSLNLETFASLNNNRKALTPVLQGGNRDLTAKQLFQHNLADILNETILEEFSYAAVFIDESFEMIHGVGDYTHFLSLPQRHFTMNLLKLVPADLSLTLGTMLRKVMRDKEKAIAHNVQVHEKDRVRYLNIVIKPCLSEKKYFQKFILVVFHETSQQVAGSQEQAVSWNDTRFETRVRELEMELQHTKEDLQSVVEELETSNEELQSTNEELLSSNEELQSTNEELQSLNEELHTINAEHQYKIKALMELDDDLNNYFRSTDLGQIYVDRDLIIRKFTPAITRQINLIDSDIGRSIFQISNNLRYENFIEDLQRTIASGKIIEREVQDKSGSWYQMRMLPYLTQERKKEGAIVLFVDINELKNLHLLQAGILDSSPNIIMAVSSLRDKGSQITDFTWTMVNSQAQKLLNRPEKELLGKSLRQECPVLVEGDMFGNYVQVVETGEPLQTEQQLSWQGQDYWLQVVAVRLNEGLVLTLQDIKDRKQHEQELIEKREELRDYADRQRMLLEAFPHITWTYQPQTEGVSFNQKYFDYTGQTPGQVAWEQIVHPEDKRKNGQALTQALASQETATSEVRLRRQDGAFRWHLVRMVPFHSENNQLNMWVGTATDIQDTKEAEAATIKLRLRQQKELLTAVLKTQEAERVRISEALHNSLGQILYATRLHLEEARAGQGLSAASHDKILDLLNQAIATTRNIAFELSPSILKDFGLKTAVQELIRRIQGNSIHFDYDINGLDERPDLIVELSVYRIIEELINNILKHSKATQAFIKLSRNSQNQLVLQVKDNGKGFDYRKLEKQKALGLNNIRNHTDLLEGSMEVASKPGQGTQITITIDLKD
ncbi:MAG: CheR family methyltransferase [Adhaeribacter sp.]